MIRTRFLKIGTIALFAAIPGCGSDAALTPGSSSQSQGSPTEIPELGISLDGLGAVVASCNNGTSNVGLGTLGTSKTMDLTLIAGSNVISVVGTSITVNGWPCYDSTGLALKTDNVKKLNISTPTTGAGAKVVLDMLPGSFSGLFTTAGGVVVTFKNTTDSFAMRGDATANKFKVGYASGTSSVYVDATGDSKADVKLTAASGGSIPTAQTYLLGDGADEFDAYDVTMVSAAHIDSTVTALAKLTSTYAMTVHGGEGDDKLRGGMGADKLYGDAGGDTFLTDIVPDGADVFSGGAGTDTVSYANRTGAVTADISPLGYSLTSTAPTVTMDGLTSSTFTVAYDSNSDGTIDGSDATPFAFVSATATSLATLASQFNATALKPAALTVKLDVNNKLVVQSTFKAQVSVTGDQTALGFGATTATPFVTAKANDGEGSENDDINSDVENLTGGTAGDTLTGNDASNKLIGGDGNDTLAGGIGATTCTADVDVLDGAAGNDTFKMGAVGDCGDEIIGGAGTDLVDYQYRTAALTVTIEGTANDGLTSELDNIKADVEELLGGSGADTITGGAGDEIIHGGAGNDVITGGAGNDTLIGNAGNDELNGGVGDDLFAASGTDSKFTVSGAGGKGEGADTMNGGVGIDKLDYSGRTQVLTVTLCTDSAAATGASSGMGQCADQDGAVLPKVTGSVNLSTGATFASGDTLVVSSTPNGGSAGNTTVTLTAGTPSAAAVLAILNNTTSGIGAFAVASLNSSGFLVLQALEGTSALSIGTSVNGVGLLIGTASAGTTSEGDKATNMDWMLGGSGADTLTGHTAGETIEGGAGADVISGGAGDDTLYGDTGADTLNGGDGNDTLNGGPAGDGTDVFNGDNGDGDICQVDVETAGLTCEQS